MAKHYAAVPSHREALLVSLVMAAVAGVVVVLAP